MYNFDEIIDRRHTNAMNTDGFRDYIFHADETMKFPYQDEEFIRMWVADMEFATPDVVIDGIKKRLEKRIFGYTRVFEKSYYDAFAAWCKSKYDWTFDRKELVMSNGIIPALFEMVEYICKPDEKVLFLTPSYAYFKYAADASHRESVCSDPVVGKYHPDHTNTDSCDHMETYRFHGKLCHSFSPFLLSFLHKKKGMLIGTMCS